MNTIEFDFSKIGNEKELNFYLADKLNLPSYVRGDYGYNLAAFWDTYSYNDSHDYFELINTAAIADNEFKKVVEAFISILSDLKQTNPNFDFSIT